MIGTRFRVVGATLVALSMLAVACSSEPAPEPIAEDSGAFCLRLRAAVSDGSRVNQIDLSDPATIDSALLQLGVVKEFAPPSISDDVDIVVDAFTQLVEALEVPDNRTDAEVIAELSETLDEAAAAGDRMATYSARECNVDLSPPATPTPVAESEEDLAPA